MLVCVCGCMVSWIRESNQFKKILTLLVTFFFLSLDEFHSLCWTAQEWNTKMAWGSSNTSVKVLWNWDISLLLLSCLICAWQFSVRTKQATKKTKAKQTKTPNQPTKKQLKNPTEQKPCWAQLYFLRILAVVTWICVFCFFFCSIFPMT